MIFLFIGFFVSKTISNIWSYHYLLVGLYIGNKKEINHFIIQIQTEMLNSELPI